MNIEGSFEAPRLYLAEHGLWRVTVDAWLPRKTGSYPAPELKCGHALPPPAGDSVSLSHKGRKRCHDGFKWCPLTVLPRTPSRATARAMWAILFCFHASFTVLPILLGASTCGPLGCLTRHTQATDAWRMHAGQVQFDVANCVNCGTQWPSKSVCLSLDFIVRICLLVRTKAEWSRPLSGSKF